MSRLVAIVSSDHHMGDGSARDDVRRSDGLRLLAEVGHIGDMIGDTGAKVVLVGDVLDAWRYRLPDCIKAHRRQLQALANLNPIYLVGNHDVALLRNDAPVLPAGFELRRLATVGGWYICHGDQFDPNPVFWRKVGKAGCRVLAKLGGWWPAAEDWLSNAAGRIEGVGRWGGVDHYEEAAVRHATACGLRGAILGHTHRGSIGATYVNTGTWREKGWVLMREDGTGEWWGLW